MMRISRPITCANQMAVASRIPRSHEVQTGAAGSYGTGAMRRSSSALPALGQTGKSRTEQMFSGLPPKADLRSAR
jgi:hypothetical protein